MSDEPSINAILIDLRAHTAHSGDAALRERVGQLESVLSHADGSISVGDISGSTAVAIGSDIQIIVHQAGNLPDDLLKKLIRLSESFERRAGELPQAAGHIRVFLASPGDVKDERRLALKAIARVQSDPFYRQLSIEAVAWDRPDDSTPLLAGIDPQSAISQGLPQPSESDIFVAIFWSRLGTPLDPGVYRKLDGRPYLSGTEWELGQALQAFKQRGRPLALVYRRTERILLDPDSVDFEEKVAQWKQVQEFFAASKNPDGSTRLSCNEYSSPSEFGELFEQHLRKLIARLVEKGQPTVNPTPLPLVDKIVPPLVWPKDKSPFPGLRAFGPDDATVFFGRGAETDRLLSRLSGTDGRFLAVVGASGSGKSSLVGAGLLPRLREGALPGSESWPIARFTPDESGRGDPFDALAWALGRSALGLDAQDLGHLLREKPTGLRQVLEETLADSPDWKRVLLFIDQFEELFTRVMDDGLRLEFCAALDEAARSARILTVVTIRDDFYNYCVETPVLSRLINRSPDSTFTLSAPGLLELHEMITGPARVAGLQFEGNLVHRILEETGTDPGALALTAYALDQLYKASREKGAEGRLSLAAYGSFDGVQGAIGARAQEIFAGLPLEAQAALPLVFRELLEVDENGTATRRRVPLPVVQRDEPCKQFTQALVQARLLVTSRSIADQPLVEVAHEALFRSWPRLKAWIEEAQDDLILLRQVRAAAQLWNNHARQPAYLWPDERLQPVYAMQKRLVPDLNSVEREFIRSEFQRLLDEIEHLSTARSHPRRSYIGERLDSLGDRRPGVGLVHGSLPLGPRNGAGPFPADELQPGETRLWGGQPEHTALPDLVWRPIDAGKIGIEGQMFPVRPFYISKYALTYRQFQAFLDAPNGFHDPRWWTGLSAEEDDKNKPGEQSFKFYNHPCENVSWYDAVAFCRWLNSRLGWPEIPPDLALKTLDGYKGLRLPTEWEWQWAAIAGHAEYEYPWGSAQDWGARANTSESGLGRTTAVGMFPTGASPYGVLDLSGNVWEWCLNEYNEPEKIGLGGEARVLRGGSWAYDRDLARPTYRRCSDPFYRDYDVGFRVVVQASPL